MIKNREVCLFLTLNCNQNCGYCHRFLGINELDIEHNKKIINKIAEDGIESMTFTGGEPLLYSNIIELLKFAKQKGIKSKIITNGEILAKNKEMREIYEYLDSLTLSIDSINSEINEKLGRGYNHYENIKTVLESLREYNLKVNINTVVSKVNIDSLQELGKFLNNYKINTWRVFKFIPLREKAKINEQQFEISKIDFRLKRPLFVSFPNIQKVEYREDEDMENKYVLIMPNGNVVVTENKRDVTIGNILENNISELLDNRVVTKVPQVVRKIRTLIAYDNETVTNNIVNAIKNLSYVEIVGVTASGLDTYNKIVDLLPEMVFTKFELGDMNAVNVVEKSKTKLDKKMPIFNLIADNLSKEQFNEITSLAGDKINAFIPEMNKEERIATILKDYKEFSE